MMPCVPAKGRKRSEFFALTHPLGGNKLSCFRGKFADAYPSVSGLLLFFVPVALGLVDIDGSRIFVLQMHDRCHDLNAPYHWYNIPRIGEI